MGEQQSKLRVFLGRFVSSDNNKKGKMSTPFIPGFLNTLTRSFETHGHLTPCLSPYDEKTETTKEGHKKDPGGRNRNSTLLLLCLTE